MNRLILLPLVILMFCATLTKSMKLESLMSNQSQAFVISSNPDTGYWKYPLSPLPSLQQNEYIEGKKATVSGFEIIGVDGILAILMGIIAIAATAGITVLGTGISNSAQNVLYKSVFYYSIWGIFSALGYGLGDYGISSIPIFGSVIYLFITLIYVIGVQSQINTHDSN